AAFFSYPFLHIATSLYNPKPMTKRIFDAVFACLGLMITSPLLLMVSGLIWITDGLPILFKQLRVGRKGKEFVG
ncbi:MAG: sugar transferase, partial [Deltaproteobacteria bacterium]|nr:sugar transferase [Deltaproteobacteria bacterium]